MSKKITLFVFGLFLLGACTTKNVVSGPKMNIKVVENIPNVAAPSWVNDTKDFWEAKGNYYYKGTAEGFTNLEAAKRAASASARTSLAEQVKSVVRSEFTRALESGSYDDTTGGYLKDVFLSVVDNLELSGIVIRESYSQRLLETNGFQEKMYYRSHVLASVSVQDYNKLVKNAFDKTNAQISANKSAKELAKEAEARFWAEQEKNK